MGNGPPLEVTLFSTIADIIGNMISLDNTYVDQRSSLERLSLGDDARLSGRLVNTCPVLVAICVRELEVVVTTVLSKKRKGGNQINSTDETTAKDSITTEATEIISLLKLLANMCHNNSRAQNSLGEAGLFGILNCSSLGVQYLSIREYSIVALKTALEGNIKNQTIVEKLKAENVVKNEITDKTGIKVNVDEFGKMHVEVEGGIGNKDKTKIST